MKINEKNLDGISRNAIHSGDIPINNLTGYAVEQGIFFR